MAGADRSANLDAAKIGSLNTITSSSGGAATLTYELNQYYDAVAAKNCYGGGLRIKSISYFDGRQNAAPMVKSYNYEQSAGISSGSLVARPSYALPIAEYHDPETGAVKTYSSLTGQALWEHFTVRTRDDLTEGDATPVAYKMVTVSRAGTGSVKYEYEVPAIYGASASGDWVATTNKFVRSGACPAMGIMSQPGTWMFPYSSNPFLDYERGLTKSVKEYNEQGALLKETAISYQQLFKIGSSPLKVWGIHYDQYPYNNSTYFYGKYFLLTETVKVPLTETVTEYDAADVNKNITSTVTYTYDTNHKLLDRITKTDNLGIIYRSKLRYPLDYGTITSPSGEQAQLISELQTLKRNGIPIETWSTVQKPGDTEKLVGASFVLLDDFGSSKIFTSKTYSIVLDVPGSNLTESYIDPTTKKFRYDSRYQQQQQIVAYDTTYSLPLTSVGLNRIPSSTHWGYGNTVPVVTAKNASHDQFTFSDFETTTGFSFQQSANVYGTGRTGKNALYPQVILTKTVQKASAANYILSFWFKKNTSALTFKFKVKNTTGTTTYIDSTYTINPPTADFTYVKKLIPATSLPSTFLIELQGQFTGSMPASSPTLLPLIDDVAFYPEEADLTSYTYDMPLGTTSVTDAAANTVFTNLDGLGRVKQIMDTDKNILKRNIYTSYDAPVTLSADFTLPKNLWDETALTFTVTGNGCMDGETYEWDFGAGFVSTGTTPSSTYTYSTIGIKTVTLRVTHPDYGMVSASQSFQIVYKPVTVTLCAKGVYKYNNCTNAVTHTYSCSDITDDIPTSGAHIKTAFLAKDDRGDELVSYQWLVRAWGATNWTSLGSSNLKIVEISIPQVSYDIKCVVSTSYGRTGESQPMSIIGLNCGDY